MFMRPRYCAIGNNMLNNVGKQKKPTVTLYNSTYQLSVFVEVMYVQDVIPISANGRVQSKSREPVNRKNVCSDDGVSMRKSENKKGLVSECTVFI